jgi:hypothetical protein
LDGRNEALTSACEAGVEGKGEMSMRVRMALMICCVLGACQTTEERLALDDTTCKSYGVQVGSPAYVQCRMTLDQNRANVKASERSGNSGGLIGFIERATDSR